MDTHLAITGSPTGIEAEKVSENLWTNIEVECCIKSYEEKIIP